MDEIYKRRSYHDGFNDSKVISDDDMKAILKAGMNAPSAFNSQPWEFVVVDNKEKLDKLATLKDSRGTRACASASHAIVICAQPTLLQKINIGITAENIILAAVNLDIGSLIMDIMTDDETQQAVLELLQIPDDYTAYIMIALGYPIEILPPNDHWIEAKVHHNKF